MRYFCTFGFDMNPFARLQLMHHVQHQTVTAATPTISAGRSWWIRTKIFAKTVFATCLLFGYGIPIANVFWYDTLHMRDKKTKVKFNVSRPPRIFPFYFSRVALENELIDKLTEYSQNTTVENTNNQTDAKQDGKCLFVYGKPRVGKSILFRQILYRMDDGM